MAGSKPAYVMVTNANNEVNKIQFGFGDTWIAVARTIDSFEPVRLVAHDIDGNILRASLMTSLLDVDPEDTNTDVTAQQAQRGPLSSNEQLLVTFGQLLAKAYEHSSTTAWTTAFGKMTEVVDIFSRRTESLENRLARMEAMFSKTIAQQGQSAVDEEPSLLGQMIGAYMQGAAAQAQAATGGKPTNGKGNPQI